MIRNFFKTAVRNLFKHKIFSFINIFGLAIGIAACLLILQYVGAGIFNILFLLTKDFIRPVMISFLIALPVTYYLLHKWLENYAFKVSINVWMFILPAFLILVIALVTISTQTVKAASANPVHSLRTE